MSTSALIVVDAQNDFCPGGALAVPEGDAIVPLINKLTRELQDRFSLVVATQDWHPAGHASFASSQGKSVGETIELAGIQQYLWPDHCVQNSSGAEFHPALDLTMVNKIIQKGTSSTIDSYSAFFDNAHQHQTGLSDYLQPHKIDTVYLAGLATDYCVKFSALDALALGFNVYLIQDACRGVNIHPEDTEKACAEMVARGVEMIQSADLLTS